MGPVIDGFAHVMPKRCLEALLKAYPTVELKELAPLTYFSDMENRLRVLDKHKIDKQVLTIARPTVWLSMPRNILPGLTRLANDAIAEVANEHPDRFIPVAHMPVPTEEYLPEFDRCINELGMAGFHIVSHIDGKPLDAPEFRPFWAKANATKTPIWLHPQLQQDWSQEWVLDKIFGWVYETSMALARLVFSGIMEQYPDLRIIPHHMGAMVPHFSERIKGFYDARSIFPRSNFLPLTKDPLEYFRRFYGDTVLNGSVHAFECGYKFFGPEHVIFGTDYPFGPKQGEEWLAGALHQIEMVDLPQAEKDLILGGNLTRLIERR
jgi:aminocarboxymuconate-semialdehyde decarboxylase